MFWRKKKQKTTPEPSGTPKPASTASEAARPKLSLLSLESRMMFDAAAAATAAEVNQEQVAQEQAESAVSAEGSGEPTAVENESLELLQAIPTYNPGESTTVVVFVDPTVPNYRELLNGMDPNIEVIMLDGAQDGVEQMAAALSGRSGIDAIHVISHGDAGTLQLGTGTLNVDSMSGQYAEELVTIQQALSEQADILVYGCNFAEGEAGQVAVNLLAEMTGADVQASTDETGHISLGGDWEFEVQTGTIETSLAVGYDAQMNWAGILGNETVRDTFSADSYSNNNGTQSWSTSWSETDAGGGGASGGDVRVNSSQLRIDTDTVGNAISRGVNLSGATSATLTFDYTNALLGADRIEVRVSTDGGTNYQTLSGGIFSSAANTGSGTASLDLSSYMSANTRIQFIVTATGGGERLYVDNVQISYQTNDAPTITSLSGDSLAYNEGDGALVIEQGANALVADVDSTNLDTGTLTISIPSGGDSAEDLLSIRNQGTGAGQIGVSGSNVTYQGVTIGTFIGGSGGTSLVITLNASATPTVVTALVKNITYQNTDTNAPTTGARTVRYVLTDGDGGTSANYDTTVTVSGVNDAPVLSSAGGSATLPENYGPVVLAASVTVSDVDSSNFDGGQLVTTITANALPEDQLTVRHVGTGAGQVGISGSNVTYGGVVVGTFNGPVSAGTSLVVTFNANATAVAVQQVARNVTYQNTSDAPSAAPRTIQGYLTDGDGGTSNVSSGTVTTTPANDAPTITNLSGDSLAYSEGNGAVVIEQSGNAVVADVDSTNLDTGTLTVSIPSGGDSAEDVLSIRNQGTGSGQIGVSGSNVTYEGTTIGTFTGGSSGSNLVITLNSNATPTAVTALVKNITYQNTDTNAPTTGARTVRYVLTDGDGGTSANYDTTVTVSGVNDAPVAADDRAGLTFDGVDDYVDMGTGAVYEVTNTVTMEAWINREPSSQSTQIIINKEGEYEVGLDADGSLKWAFANTNPGWAWHDTGVVIPVHTWTHIAVTYDNGTITSYVNGVAVETFAGSGMIGDAHPTRDSLRIGGRENNPANQYFNGQISEARVWNIARTAGEIAADLNSTLTGSETGLLGCWKFNENTGTTADNLTANSDGTLGGGVAGQTPQWAIYRVNEDTSLTVSGSGVLGNDYDADGDTLSAIMVTGPSNSSAFTLNPDGSFSYTPSANFSGTDSFTYRVSDGTNQSNVATVYIQVDSVNDAPTITNLSGDSLSYSEGDGAVVIEQGANALVADVDSTNLDTGTLTISIPSGGDSAEDVLSIRNQGTGAGQIGVSGSNVTYQGVTIGTFTGGSGGSNLVITLNSSATPTAVTALVKNITYQNTDTNAPTTGARTVRYVLTDGDGGTSANYDTTVTVSGVNDAPVNTVPGAQTVDEDTPLALSGVSVTDVDGNLSTVQLGVGNGTLAVTLAGGATISAGSNGSGTLTLSGSQADINATLATLVYQGALNYNGADTLTVTSTDANSGTDVDTVAITVTAVDDPTVVTGGTSGTGNEDTTVTGTLTATDVEGLSDGTVFTVSTNATNGTASIDPATGLWSYTPTADWNGSDSFTVTITDDAGNTSTQVISVTVTPVNDAPTLTVNTGSTVAEGGTDTIDSTELAVTDPDNTAAQLRYTIGTGPAYGRLELTTDPGVSASTFTQADIIANRLVYIHNESETTSDSFTLTVSDGSGGSIGSTTVTLTITPVNDTPTITSGGGGATFAINVAENVSAVMIVTGADVDLPAQALTYSVSGGADQALFTINAVTGALSFTAPRDFEVVTDANGDNVYVVQVRVTDSQGASTVQTLQVTVTDVAEVLPSLLLTTATGPTGPGPIPSSLSGPPIQSTDGPPLPPIAQGPSATPSESHPATVLPSPTERLVVIRPEEPRATIDEAKDSVLFPWIEEARRLLLTGLLGEPTPTPESEPAEKSQSVSDLLFSKLEEMTASLEQAMGMSQEQHVVTVRIAALTGSTLSAGFIAWALRSGTLLASFMATMPAWRHFDPLPVLGGSRSEWERRKKEAEQDQQAENSEFQGLKHLLNLGLPPDPKC
jgi:VCBS repeat-containing protein